MGLPSVRISLILCLLLVGLFNPSILLHYHLFIENMWQIGLYIAVKMYTRVPTHRQLHTIIIRNNFNLVYYLSLLSSPPPLPKPRLSPNDDIDVKRSAHFRHEVGSFGERSGPRVSFWNCNLYIKNKSDSKCYWMKYQWICNTPHVRML